VVFLIVALVAAALGFGGVAVEGAISPNGWCRIWAKASG